MAKAKTTKINPKTFGITGPTSRGSGRPGRGISLAGGGGGGFGQPVSTIPDWLDNGWTEGINFQTSEAYFADTLYRGTDFTAMLVGLDTDLLTADGLAIPSTGTSNGHEVTSHLVGAAGALFDKLRALDYCIEIQFEADVTAEGNSIIYIANGSYAAHDSGLEAGLWYGSATPGFDDGTVFVAGWPGNFAGQWTIQAGVNVLVADVDETRVLGSMNGGPANNDATAGVVALDETAVVTLGSYTAAVQIGWGGDPDSPDGQFPLNGSYKMFRFRANGNDAATVEALSAN